MTQRLPPSLTPLDTALAMLLRGVDPVEPVQLPLDEAADCISAGMPLLPAHPPRDIAAVDGWALCANDLVGASSYSPLPLAELPVWVETGDAMPEGCDCVLDADAVGVSGPLAQVLVEGVPGQGVARAGSDIAGNAPVVTAGYPVGAAALLLARVAGRNELSVRRPRLRIVNVPGGTATMQMIASLARKAGLDVSAHQAASRGTASIGEALDASACDLLLTIGGSGVGHADGSVAALVQRGAQLNHGLALQPGRTAASGRLGKVPVVVLPGSPAQALAVWLALVLPLIDRFSARQPRRAVTLPLARKIASSVGIAEIALLAEEHKTWRPLAVGEHPPLEPARLHDRHLGAQHAEIALAVGVIILIEPTE